MTQDDLPKVLEDLWKNWAFRLSLSSNELFHSNVLQYLVETSAESSGIAPLAANQSAGVRMEDLPAGPNPTDSDIDSNGGSEPTVIDKTSAIRLLKVLSGENCSACSSTFTRLYDADENVEFSVHREWRHMDLVILWRKQPEVNWRPIFALEVKVKAYPEPEQLMRYREVLDSKWKTKNGPPDYQPPLFLLTGMGNRSIQDSKLDHTYVLDFQEIAAGLTQQKCHTGQVAKEYIALCGLLHHLFHNLGDTLTPGLSWKEAHDPAKQMHPYRLHSLWWKLWASDVARQCREKLPATEICRRYLHVYSGYTHQGNLGVCWKWPVEDGTKTRKPKESISIGVQIEGSSVRLFLNIVHPSLGTAQKSRELVEKVLLNLMTSAGVFAANPGMQSLIEYWDSSPPKPFNNKSAFTARSSPTDLTPPCPKAEALFDGSISKGQKNKDFIPMLNGYANGDGNGFADIRLTLKGDCTIDAVAQMVRDVLINDLFSSSKRTEGQDPLLLRVVKGFEAADDRNVWIKNPTLAPWSSPTST